MFSSSQSSYCCLFTGLPTKQIKWHIFILHKAEENIFVSLVPYLTSSLANDFKSFSKYNLQTHLNDTDHKMKKTNNSTADHILGMILLYSCKFTNTLLFLSFYAQNGASELFLPYKNPLNYMFIENKSKQQTLFPPKYGSFNPRRRSSSQSSRLV